MILLVGAARPFWINTEAGQIPPQTWLLLPGFYHFKLVTKYKLHVSYCYVQLFSREYSEIDAAVFQSPKITFRLFQKAIFVEPTKWSDCNDEMTAKWSQSDVAMSIVPLYTSKIFHNLKILIYSGDVDSVVPTVGKILQCICNFM